MVRSSSLIMTASSLGWRQTSRPNPAIEMKSGFDLTELALQLVMLLTWLCTFQRFTKILFWRGAGCEAGGSNGGGRGASSRKGLDVEGKARAAPAGVSSTVRVKSRPLPRRAGRGARGEAFFAGLPEQPPSQNNAPVTRGRPAALTCFSDAHRQRGAYFSLFVHRYPQGGAWAPQEAEC